MDIKIAKTDNIGNKEGYNDDCHIQKQEYISFNQSLF
jgi:hypothetical protein